MSYTDHGRSMASRSGFAVTLPAVATIAANLRIKRQSNVVIMLQHNRLSPVFAERRGVAQHKYLADRPTIILSYHMAKWRSLPVDEIMNFVKLTEGVHRR
jgi:hypothetical protein